MFQRNNGIIRKYGLILKSVTLKPIRVNEIKRVKFLRVVYSLVMPSVCKLTIVN